MRGVYTVAIARSILNIFQEDICFSRVAHRYIFRCQRVGQTPERTVDELSHRTSRDVRDHNTPCVGAPPRYLRRKAIERYIHLTEYFAITVLEQDSLLDWDSPHPSRSHSPALSDPS